MWNNIKQVAENNFYLVPYLRPAFIKFASETENIKKYQMIESDCLEMGKQIEVSNFFVDDLLKDFKAISNYERALKKEKEMDNNYKGEMKKIAEQIHNLMKDIEDANGDLTDNELGFKMGLSGGQVVGLKGLVNHIRGK